MKRRDCLSSLLAAPLVLPSAAWTMNQNLFPNQKRFAVSFSSDDGFLKSTETFMTLFDQYNFKATFNLVTSWITPMKSSIGDSYNQDCSHGTWTNWKTVIKKGHEIGSHSMTHPHLPDLSPEDLKRELLYSKRRISKRLDYHGHKTLALPYNHLSFDVRNEIARYYIAAREGTRTGKINIPNETDLMAVRSWWPLSHTGLDEIIDMINQAREERGWLVIGLHGMNGEGWHPITTQKMSGVLDYLSEQNDVYVDTFKNTALWLKKTTNA